MVTMTREALDSWEAMRNRNGMVTTRPTMALRDREQVSASVLAKRAQALLREAYDKLGSAGALLLTVGNAASPEDRETIALIRRVIGDASADVSCAAYALPSDLESN